LYFIYRFVLRKEQDFKPYFFVVIILKCEESSVNYHQSHDIMNISSMKRSVDFAAVSVTLAAQMMLILPGLPQRGPNPASTKKFK
jgi:hypothetical protein